LMVAPAHIDKRQLTGHYREYPPSNHHRPTKDRMPQLAVNPRNTSSWHSLNRNNP